MTSDTSYRQSIYASIGIFARNEERAIGAALESLFEQSLFSELRERGAVSEILCLVNGCTDRTPVIAEEIFQAQQREHPAAAGFCPRVVSLAQRGKVNAWNQFVHVLSAREARFLFLMDADIVIHRQGTLWNMLQALEKGREANIAVDQPRKDLAFKSRRPLRARLSLAASRMTQAAPAQLCGQLYCIRAEVARNIYLPRDLAACEDGFIKALVCTDFLAHEVWPQRICLAERAEHTFEAYTSPLAILRNQKRQMIGQTIVHILVDLDLPRQPASDRGRLAETLKVRDVADPLWLKRLIAQHLRRTRFFWRLYPGLLGQRFRMLKELRGWRRLLCLPAAVAGWFASLVASLLAWTALKGGCTDYWPEVNRLGTEKPREEQGRVTSALPGFASRPPLRKTCNSD
jgi:glycosyltransferase involved in cell wall biosynthesis